MAQTLVTRLTTTNCLADCACNHNVHSEQKTTGIYLTASKVTLMKYLTETEFFFFFLRKRHESETKTCGCSARNWFTESLLKVGKDKQITTCCMRKYTGVRFSPLVVGETY